MRNLLIPSSLFASALLLGAFAACGGDDTAQNGGTDSGTGSDVGKPDGKTDGGGPSDTGGGDVVSVKNLMGSTMYSVKIVSGPFGAPTTGTDKGMPVAMAAVRVETASDNGASFLDFTADANGVVNMMLDATQAPFNITAAAPMMGAGSLMGISTNADIGGKSIWIPTPLVVKTYNISGAISNLKTGTDAVQLDCADFSTLWLKSGMTANYMTTQEYVAADVQPVNIAAIEIDSSNNAVQGIWGPTHARTNAPMPNIGVDFTGADTNVIKGTATITLPPAGGQFDATMVKGVGDQTIFNYKPGAWTNSTVAKTVGQSAAYTGIAILGMPTAGVSKLVMQTFAGMLQPSYVDATWLDSKGTILTYLVTTFTDSAISIPKITKLAVTSNGTGAPTALDDTQFDFDATGADFVTATLVESGSQTGASWYLYFPKVTGTGIHMPHLPAAVMLGDFTTAATLLVNLDGVKGTVPSDWAAGSGTISTWSYGVQANPTATGR